MEKNPEINDGSYTTEYRQLDTRIGRWLSVDPKADIQPNFSPYISMNNNPVLHTDPKGDIVPPLAYGIIMGMLKIGAAGAIVNGGISMGVQYAQTRTVRFDKTALAAGTGFFVANTPGGWMAGGAYAFGVGTTSNIIDQVVLDNKPLSKVNYRQSFALGAFTTASFGVGNMVAPVAKSKLSKMLYSYRSSSSTQVSASGGLYFMMQTRSISSLKREILKNADVYSTVIGNGFGDALIGAGTLDFAIGTKPIFLNHFFENVENMIPDFGGVPEVLSLGEPVSSEETLQMLLEYQDRGKSKKTESTKTKTSEFRDAMSNDAQSSSSNTKKRRY